MRKPYPIQLGLLCLLGVVAIESGCGPRPAPKGRRLAIMLPVPLIEGSLEECIRRNREQGLTLAQATDQCRVYDSAFGVSPGGSALDSLDLGAPGATGVANISCSGTVADQRLGAAGRIPPFQIGNLLGRIDALRATRDHLNALALAKETQAATTNDTAEAEAARREAAQARAEADRFDRLARELFRFISDVEEAGDFPPPKTDGTAVARPSPDDPALQACGQLQQFIGDCNLAGWSTAPCALFLAKLEGCADPTVTDPEPGAEKTCGLPPIDGEKAADVVAVLCSQRGKVPYGDDPCTKLAPEGRAYTFRQASDQPLCNDPRAMFEPGSCAPAFTIAVFGNDLSTTLTAMQKKLGGPVFVLPNRDPQPPTDTGRGPRPTPPP